MTDTPMDGTLDEPGDEPADPRVEAASLEPTDATTTDATAATTTGATADATTDGPKVPPARRTRWGTRTRVGVASLALTAMMFLFVFPTRSYLAQQRQVGNARHAVAVLKAQNEVLARQARRLKTPAEIERLAREQFNMVLPGEQAYNVVNLQAGSWVTTTTTAR